MKVLHILKLSGIGGVQSQFVVFYNNLTKKEKCSNFIVNIRSIDPVYSSLIPSSNKYLLKLFIYLFFRDVLVHSYNNLTSKKYYRVYRLLRPNNLIFHERGNAWNLNSSEKQLVIDNAKLSKVVLCNSEAARIILNQKFDISLDKLEVIYNGVLSDQMIAQAANYSRKRPNDKFIIGYVGRLESNKGVQALIESMQYLDSDIFQLNIIGDGSLRGKLEEYVLELDLKSVDFFGRMKDAWSEMRNFDVIVVPSIREPLGNVIIEAALYKVPVVASRVDGIVEIIDDNYSGILLTPSLPVDERFVSENVPLPEYVVDVENNKLVKPMQLKPAELAEAIKFVYGNSSLALQFSERLYNKVIDKFHIDKYSDKLFEIYQKVLMQIK